MPGVDLHDHEGRQVRHSPEHANPQVRKSGLTFQHGREPESEAVKHEIIEKGNRCQQQNCARFERLPHRYLLDADIFFFMQFLFNPPPLLGGKPVRSEEHTSELQSHLNLVCRLLLEKKKKKNPSEPRSYDHITAE